MFDNTSGSETKDMTTDFHLTPQGKRVHEEIIAPSPDCKKCNHFGTCIIWRFASQQLMPNFPDKSEPFAIGDLARICKYYALGSEDGR